MADAADIQSPDSLDLLLRRCQPALVRRLTLVVGDPDEAEDIAQQAFDRAAERRLSLTADKLPSWLTFVGLRLAIGGRLRRRRWGFLPLREADIAWARETDPDLWRLLSTLDRRTRAALVLTVLDGSTPETVAFALDEPREVIGDWLDNARDTLRPLIEESSE
jgi:DNA-directed RNA polymerase specialized sigma24 family protein